MISKVALALVAGLALTLPSPALAQQLFAYPMKGQTPQQQSRDEQECAGWAVQQSGSRPGNSQAPSTGGTVRGAVGGGAVGAIGGAIGGNTGKGAAIGAVAGGLVGSAKQDKRNKKKAKQAKQANDAYSRAYAACLQGRGYSVQ